MKVLALDFGGSSVKYGLVDEKGEITTRGKVDAPRESEQQFAGVVHEILAALPEKPAAIGISMGGKLNPDTGVIMSSGQFPFFNGRSLSDWFRRETGLPTTIQNDAHAAAIAELNRGSLQGVKNAIVIVLGSGIGGCVVVDGKILEGAHYCATEFSLLRADGSRDWHRSWLFCGGAGGLIYMA